MATGCTPTVSCLMSSSMSEGSIAYQFSMPGSRDAQRNPDLRPPTSELSAPLAICLTQVNTQLSTYERNSRCEGNVRKRCCRNRLKRWARCSACLCRTSSMATDCRCSGTGSIYSTDRRKPTSARAVTRCAGGLPLHPDQGAGGCGPASPDLGVPAGLAAVRLPRHGGQRRPVTGDGGDRRLGHIRAADSHRNASEHQLAQVPGGSAEAARWIRFAAQIWRRPDRRALPRERALPA
jgi:hypothetical protein